MNPSTQAGTELCRRRHGTGLGTDNGNSAPAIPAPMSILAAMALPGGNAVPYPNYAGQGSTASRLLAASISQIHMARLTAAIMRHRLSSYDASGYNRPLAISVNTGYNTSP